MIKVKMQVAVAFLFTLSSISAKDISVNAIDEDYDVFTYDPESVNLVVNIALSLFDSLQNYYARLKQHETNQTVQKIKFRPQSVSDNTARIETNDVDEVEINVNVNEKVENSNLENHRNTTQLTKEEIQQVTKKLTLENEREEIQHQIQEIINQNLIDKWNGVLTGNSSANQNADVNQSEDVNASKEPIFPNIYSQSDSVFDSKEEFFDISKIQKPMVQVQTDVYEPQEKKTEVKDIVTSTQKLPKRKRKKKRPLDRENWNHLAKHKNLTAKMSSKSNIDALSQKRRRRKRRRKGLRNFRNS